jgi:hypothetical protein
MLDFTRVRNKEIPMIELVAGLGKSDLRALTNEMIDTMLGLIQGCSDADVVFQPVDAKANDTFAGKPEDVSIAWTLGHLVVHVTASSEESASIATELARGVEYHGRSRSEIPWESVTTIAQCHHRLEESRRMRLASLELWPDAPYLANSYEPWAGAGQLNAPARFCSGLRHDDDHVGQLAEVVRQAKAAR